MDRTVLDHGLEYKTGLKNLLLAIKISKATESPKYIKKNEMFF